LCAAILSRNDRVGLSFLVDTISKNALAVIIVRRLAVLDRIGKVFSSLMPAQTLKLCIIYIPQMHFQQRGPQAAPVLVSVWAQSAAASTASSTQSSASKE
jgi:hypothetical protein